MNFVPKMDAARLVEGYREILRTIYSPSEYYQRALECLKRVSQEGPAPQQYGLLKGVASLSRVAFKLGVLDRERGEFWRFFRHALTEHRGKFAESMRLAAMGYHFRKLAEVNG